MQFKLSVIALCHVTLAMFLPTVQEDPKLQCGKCPGCEGLLKNMLFKNMKTLTLRHDTTNKQESCKIKPPAMNLRAFGDKLYVCDEGGHVMIYDHKLIVKGSHSNPKWDGVNDVTVLPKFTVLPEKRLAVASKNGLFQASDASYLNEPLEKDEVYGSCVVVNKSLYACCNSHQRIYEYRFDNNKWRKVRRPHIYRQMSLQSRVKLAATANNTIIFGGTDPDTIYEMTLDGDSVVKHERKGAGAGELHLCAADAEGSILVADTKNNSLWVCEPSGAWTELDLRPPVTRPRSAVVINNKLCVASDNDNELDNGNELFLYTPIIPV